MPSRIPKEDANHSAWRWWVRGWPGHVLRKVEAEPGRTGRRGKGWFLGLELGDQNRASRASPALAVACCVKMSHSLLPEPRACVPLTRCVSPVGEKGLDGRAHGRPGTHTASLRARRARPPARPPSDGLRCGRGHRSLSGSAASCMVTCKELTRRGMRTVSCTEKQKTKRNATYEGSGFLRAYAISRGIL